MSIWGERVYSRTTRGNPPNEKFLRLVYYLTPTPVNIEHKPQDQIPLAEFTKFSTQRTMEVGAAPPIGSQGQSNESLADYLARPIKIATFSWTQASGFKPYQHYPFEDWYNMTAVQRKLAGYGSIAGNFHLFVTVTGSPFQFGKLTVSLRPGVDVNQSLSTLPNYSGYGGHMDEPASAEGTAEVITAMALSQRPHAHIYPTECSSAHLTMPLVVPWERVPRATIGAGTGDPLIQADYWSITRLKSVGSSNDVPCHVQVYAYMDDLILDDKTASFQSAAATSSLFESGSDTQLSDMLIEGAEVTKSDTAISAALLTFGAIARATGMSNAGKTSAVPGTFPTGLPGLASVERSTHTDTLSLTDKSRLQKGMLAKRYHDELDVALWGSIPSHIGQCNISPTTAVNTVIFAANVTPFNFASRGETAAGTTPYTQIQLTPAAYAALAFEYWRGDVVYELEFVGSKMHRGQLRVFFDPVSATSHSEGFIKSCIWDIAESTHLSVRIPYSSVYAMKTVRCSGESFASRVYNFQTNADDNTLSAFELPAHMGRLTVETHTRISAVASTDPAASIIVTARVENLELFKPTQPVARVLTPASVGLTMNSPYRFQSVAAGETDIFTPTSATTPDVGAYIGEKITSLRALCHRATLGTAVVGIGTLDGTLTSNRINLPIEPLSFGFDYGSADGLTYPYLTATTGLVRTGVLVVDRKFNWNPTHPSTYFAGAFALKRGGYRWRFLPQYSRQATTNATSITVSLPLDPTSVGSTSLNGIAWSTLTTSGKMEKELSYQFNGFSGIAACTNPTEVCDVVIPMQTRFLAEGTNTYKGASSTVYYDQKKRVMQVNWQSAYSTAGARAGNALRSYVSADTDFDVFYFINAPRLYELITLPTAQ